MSWGRYLVFSITPICWLRSMSSISCFCRIFSLPTVCLMNTCWSRSRTFGRSSKSLIRHLRGGRRSTERQGKDLYSRHLVISVNIYYSHRKDKHTHLQMKSLNSSDQSSGWWRVGGGFLLKEEMEKINGKIRWDGIHAGRVENKRLEELGHLEAATSDPQSRAAGWYRYRWL